MSTLSPKKLGGSKRKASDESDSDEHDTSVMSANKSAKKPKKDLSMSSFMDNEEEEDDLESEGLESGEHGNGIDPVSMADYVKSLAEFMEKSGKGEVTIKTFHRYVDDFLVWKGIEKTVETETFVKSFRKYLAMAMKHLTVKDSVGPLLAYLERGDSILSFPDFPARPPHLINYYAKKKNISCGFGKIAEVKAAMLADHEGRQECEHEVGILEAKFLADMESFGESHELSSKQKGYLERKIKAFRKKLHGPVQKTPRKPKAKAATAFDLFCKTKTDKYTDLDTESREKKLLKKFNKLDEATKEIFERLALSR